MPEEAKSWETRRGALAGALRGVGLRSQPAVRLMRRLCEAGDAQLVLEAVADVMLAESVSSGALPANAGTMSTDLAYAVEAAVIDLVNDYHLDGNPLTSRWSSPSYLVAEICKQWLASFSAPIQHTYSIRGTLSDPEVQDRLTVVALRLKELILDRTAATGGEAEASGYHLDAEDLEGLCRDASLAMFTAFEKPNETNHEIIHRRKPDAR